MACCRFLRPGVLFHNLFFWSGFARAGLVLDYSRLGIWCIGVAPGVGGIQSVFAFFDSYSALHGSLGAAMVLLAWLYMTGLAFLIGGEINAEIERAAATELLRWNRVQFSYRLRLRHSTATRQAELGSRSCPWTLGQNQLG